MSVLQNKHPLKTLNGNRLLAAYGSLSLRPSTGKRKSAVEMLQETKAFYVKSERVLDARQQMEHAGHLQVSPTQLIQPTWLRHSDPSPALPTPPAPPPPPPRPPSTPLSRVSPEKPPPLPARSPGCRSQPRTTRTPPGSVTPGRSVRERPARHSGEGASLRPGDSVQSRLRQLLTPSREPVDTCGGRHKSLPDISADGGACSDSAGSGSGSGSGSLAGRHSRSDARSGGGGRSRGHATSDYVSHSAVSASAASQLAAHRTALTDDGRGAVPAASLPHRPVARSKSDISHRHDRAGAGFGLWPPAAAPPLPARADRRGSAELGRFFDQLGMDGERFRGVARTPSDHWLPPETASFWDGLSAGSSRGRRTSGASDASSAGPARWTDGRLRTAALTPAASEPSIVEKNARIVKWLFHVRKAQEEWALGVT